MRARGRRSFLLFSLAATAACTVQSLDSSKVEPRELRPDVRVRASGDGRVLVDAFLVTSHAGLDTSVWLGAGEALFAEAGGESQRLDAPPDTLLQLRACASSVACPRARSYATVISADDTEGATFSVGYQRKGSDGRLESSCTLPAPFELESPPEHAQVSRRDAVRVTYRGARSDRIHWRVSGACVEDAEGDADAADGSFVLPPGSLHASAHDDGQTCLAWITASRESPGSVDAAFGGGTIVCEQVRGVLVQSAP